MMLFSEQYHLLLLASINRSLNIWRLSVAVPWVLICFVSIRNIGGCVDLSRDDHTYNEARDPKEYREQRV